MGTIRRRFSPLKLHMKLVPVYLSATFLCTKQYIIQQKLLMRCLQEIGSAINTTRYFLYKKICKAVSELPNKSIGLVNQLDVQKFKIVLKQKRSIQARLMTHWTISTNTNLEIVIQLIDEHQNLLHPESGVSIVQVVKQLNTQTFMGTYFTKSQQSHLLGFRYKVPLVILRNYLSGTIRQIYEQISQKFTWFASKIRIIGGNSDIKSSKIHLALLKLQHLKEQFEINRFTRKKAYRGYDLSNSSMKVVDDALKLVAEQSVFLETFRTGTMNSNKRSRCKTVNNRVSKELNNYFDELKKTAVSSITSGIEVNGTFNEKQIGQGGFSLIYKGQYLVSLYPTVNPKLAYDLKQQYFRSNLEKRVLVRKTFKNQQNRQSHENEINFLTFIRNQRHPLVSAYFLPAFQRRDEEMQEDAPTNIFMEYYQMNLYEANLQWKTLEQRLNASLQMFNGIYFLQQKGVLHRDLKEINMLVDNKNNLKMIDFGSTCQIYQEKPIPGTFSAISKELRSTKYYFYPFSQLQSQYPMIANKYSRQQYEQAQTFDVYSAGTILTNLYRLNDQLFDTIYHLHLNFLASKCHQRNPEDRYTPQEAFCYIYTINELFNAFKAWQVPATKYDKPEPKIISLEGLMG